MSARNSATDNPVNHLMVQTLALCLSELNQHTACEVIARTDETPIGAAALVELSWEGSGGPERITLTQFVSRQPGPETLELAGLAAADVQRWLEARGWQADPDTSAAGLDRVVPGVGFRTVLRRPAPVPLIPPASPGLAASPAAHRVTPLLDALRSENTCAILHEYSYETRGGIAITDEVALQWGRQARALRSEESKALSAAGPLFSEGETFAAQAVAFLISKGWALEKRDRQWQGSATLSNEAATNITISFTLRRRKRFGIF